MIHYKMTHLRICDYHSLAKIEEAKEHFSNQEGFFNEFRLMASIMSFWKIHILLVMKILLLSLCCLD